MSDDPKSPKTDLRVPSFDELKAPKRAPAAQPPSQQLGEEEKTTQINPELLKAALKQSQQGAPIEPPPKPAPLAITSTGKLPLTTPAKPPPPPPGGKRADPTTDPETSPVLRAAPPTALETPAVAPPAEGPTNIGPPPTPVIKPQTLVRAPIPGRAPPPPPGGPSSSKPQAPLSAKATERMDPVTPDMINAHRQASPRAAAPVQAAAPASPKPETTQVTAPHRMSPPDDPGPHGKTLLDERPRGAQTVPPQPLSAVTQPNAPNPFLSSRAIEPSSGDRPAAPPPASPGARPSAGAPSAGSHPHGWDEPEPLTRNERPSSRPQPTLDIEADIASEVKKLRTDVGATAVTQPGGIDLGRVAAEPEAATGEVALLEVLASPAPVGRRLGALLVDALVLGALDVLISMAVLAVGKAPPLPERTGLLDALALRAHDSGKLLVAIAILAVGVAAAYSTLFAVAWSGRTLGRRLLGLHLVDQRGAPPSPLRALARSLLALVSFALCCSGFWWWLFDRQSQTLHDKLCSTFVVRLKGTRS